MAVSSLSCTVWKKNLRATGNYETAINNAILDFINTSHLCRKYNLFNIYFVFDTVGMVLITGVESDEKPCDTNELPCIYNRLYEHEGRKLFIWKDDKYPDNPDVVKKLDEYNMLGERLVLRVDYWQNSVIYYFCPQNLKKYVKVRGYGTKLRKRKKALYDECYKNK